jgi:hypothetical protein
MQIDLQPKLGGSGDNSMRNLLLVIGGGPKDWFSLPTLSTVFSDVFFITFRLLGVNVDCQFCLLGPIVV